MSADARDDFGAFATTQHMFYGITDPFALIREEVERALCGQVAGTVVDAIRTYDEPKWLTLGRQADGDPHVIVTYFACCVRAQITVTSGDDREELTSALTLMFGRIDEPGREVMRTHMDLHDDADRGFDASRFEARFMQFRRQEPPTTAN
jgi:hypothetical protein